MTQQNKNNIPLLNHWKTAKLGEVCSQPQYGYTTSASKIGKTKLLRTTDITSGEVNWATVPFCKIEPKDLSKYILQDGDIVISRAGSIGVSYLLNEPEKSVFASYLIRFKPFENIIYRKYFYLFLKSPFYWNEITEKSLGIAVPNVNASKLKEIPIPLPPIPEQHRIVAKIEELFSELDKGVENLKKAKEQLKVYRQSVLKWAFEGKLTEEWREKRIQNDEVNIAAEPDIDYHDLRKNKLPSGWKYKKLKNVAEIIMGQSPPGSSYNFEGKGLPLINGPVEFGETPLSKTIKKKFTTNPKKMCCKDDLILCVRGSTTGRTNIAGFDGCIGRGVAAIRATESQNFLNWYVISLRQKIFKIGTGSTFPNISLSQIKELYFSLPPVEEQHQIVHEIETRLSVVDKLEQNIDQSLQQAEALRQSILKKAFEGKLVEK